MNLPPIRLSIAKMRQSFCPYLFDPWGSGNVTLEAVDRAVVERRICRDETSVHHIERIAYLVLYGWRDPIEIDIGVRSLDAWRIWPVVDGNHRYCASIYQRHEYIWANVSGAVTLIEELKWVPDNCSDP